MPQEINEQDVGKLLWSGAKLKVCFGFASLLQQRCVAVSPFRFMSQANDRESEHDIVIMVVQVLTQSHWDVLIWKAVSLHSTLEPRSLVQIAQVICRGCRTETNVHHLAHDAPEQHNVHMKTQACIRFCVMS